MYSYRTFLLTLFLFAISCSFKDQDTSSSNSNTNASDQGMTEDDSGAGSQGGDADETGPTIWSGPTLQFTKENFADHELAEHQDRITEGVVLTRGAKGSLINIAMEVSANTQSPSGTEWAEGTSSDLDILDFEPLKLAANNQMKNVPGKSFVLHLIEEDVYIDVTFLSWTTGSSSGGGFSYERTTE